MPNALLMEALKIQGALADLAAAIAKAIAAELGLAIHKLEQAKDIDFAAVDQKSNQLMNMLTAVVKTINEIRGIGAGSRSGL